MDAGRAWPDAAVCSHSTCRRDPDALPGGPSQPSPEPGHGPHVFCGRIACVLRPRDAMGTMDVSEARGLWEPAGVYCNTASYGLPPRPAWDAMQSALADWHGGRTSWEHWGQSTENARAAF